MESLPEENKATFKFLIKFLIKVDARSKKNLMEKSTLATVFAPTVMRPKKETTNTMGDSANANYLFQTVLENANLFTEVFL